MSKVRKMNNSQPSYSPTPDEIERMKEQIFRENLAAEMRGAGRRRSEPSAQYRPRGIVHMRDFRSSKERKD